MVNSPLIRPYFLGGGGIGGGTLDSHDSRFDALLTWTELRRAGKQKKRSMVTFSETNSKRP